MFINTTVHNVKVLVISEDCRAAVYLGQYYLKSDIYQIQDEYTKTLEEIISIEYCFTWSIPQ